MGEYKRIVVGTSGSAASEKAIEAAAAIAREVGSELIITCVYDGSRRPDSRETDILKQDGYQLHPTSIASAILRDAREQAVRAGATRVVEYLFEGQPNVGLSRAVDDNDADLLVIGSSGVRSITARMFGSLATNLARTSPVDLLIVNTNE